MLRRPSVFPAIALLAIVATGCTATEPATLTEADRAAIRQQHADSVKAANAKDWAKWTAGFAENGVAMPSNSEAIRGHSALLKFAEGYPPFTNFTAEVTEVEGSATMAYARGTYAITITMPGMSPMPDKGKFLEIWKKQPDGSWKVAIDMFNSDMPMPAPAPVVEIKKN